MAKWLKTLLHVNSFEEKLEKFMYNQQAKGYGQGFNTTIANFKFTLELSKKNAYENQVWYM